LLVRSSLPSLLPIIHTHRHTHTRIYIHAPTSTHNKRERERERESRKERRQKTCGKQFARAVSVCFNTWNFKGGAPKFAAPAIRSSLVLSHKWRERLHQLCLSVCSSSLSVLVLVSHFTFLLSLFWRTGEATALTDQQWKQSKKLATALAFVSVSMCLCV
jgi:hypothetical protein